MGDDRNRRPKLFAGILAHLTVIVSGGGNNKRYAHPKVKIKRTRSRRAAMLQGTAGSPRSWAHKVEKEGVRASNETLPVPLVAR